MNKVRILWEESHKVGRRWDARALILGIHRTAAYPEGIKYTVALIDLETGERVLAIDNCAGHGHHIHIRDEVRPYNFVNERQLKKDFWMLAETIMGEDT